MRISIHQPAYLPWLGYIEKIVNSDMFVFLDTVAYSKNSFDNRNRILLDGKDHWLTIPIKTAHNLGQNYIDSKPASDDWKRAHPMTIANAYRKAPFWNEYKGILNVYNELEADNLSEICWIMLFHLLKPFSHKIGKRIDAVRHSYFVPTKATGSDLVLEICKKLHATEYYSGPMGRNYLNEDSFKEAGIKITYQEYKPQNYYSVIHQLFNVGPIL